MKIGLCYETRESHGYNNVNIHCCNYPSQKTVDMISNLIVQNGFEICLFESPNEIFTTLNDAIYDLAFPMICDSNGRGQQTWLPSTLELRNIPFVGSDARSILLSSDKFQTGLLAKEYGVSTIPSIVLFDSDGNKQTVNMELSFPGIVKPNYESDSKGVYLVQDEKEMWLRTEEDWLKYKGKILFQPYISGTEITVSLYENNGEPVIFGIAETIGSDGQPLKLYTYEHKHLYHCQKRRPNISPHLYEMISRYAKIMFKVLECHDYARIDFRIDPNGIPYLLEATLTPSLPLSASFFMGGTLCGVKPNEVMQHIISSAIKRHNLCT